MNEILNLYQENKTGYIDIYGAIMPDAWIWGEDDADTSAMSFRKQLDKFEDIDEIVVNINSPGGSVFEGVSIFNMLKNHPAKVTVNVDGLAASIASVIAMAGDVVKMPSNSMIMIHNAMTGEFGNAKELRKAADDLDKINQSVVNSYLTKVPSMNTSELQEMLDAETWLDADDALKLGMVDEVVRPVQAVAKIDDELMARFKSVPDKVKNMIESEKEPSTGKIDGLKLNVNFKMSDIEGYDEFMATLSEVKAKLDEQDKTNAKQITNKEPNRLYY